MTDQTSTSNQTEYTEQEFADALARVIARHPTFTKDQAEREARFVLAIKYDRAELSLYDLDVEARQVESEQAHATEANSHRAFTKRAMLK